MSKAHPQVDITQAVAFQVDGQTRWLGKATFPKTPRPRSLVVLPMDGELVAFAPTCPHEQADLSRAPVSGFSLECPAHRVAYDLREGGIRAYKVEREGERLSLLWEPLTNSPVPPDFVRAQAERERLSTLEREVTALTEAAQLRQRQMVETLEQMDGMIREVERKKGQAEEASRQLGSVNAFVSRVTDTMTEGLLVLDAHGRVREVNQRFAALLGERREDLKGRALEAVFPGDELASLRAQVKGGRDGEVGREAELALRGADGGTVELLVRTAQLYDAAGKREGAVVVGTDIRRMKQAQREVALAYEKVSNLLNSMRQSVFVVLESGQIVEPVSHFSTEVFGRPIVGANVFETLFADLDRRGEAYPLLAMGFAATFGAEAFQWDVMADHFPRRVVYRGPGGPDAEPKILRVEYCPLRDAAGLQDRLMVIVDDVTNVELLERERQSHERQTTILKELATCGPAALRHFFAGAGAQLHEARRLTGAHGLEAHATLMRALHTLKGNARLNHFGFISRAAHEAENVATTLAEQARPEGERQAAVDALQRQLSALQLQVSEYAQVAETLLNVPNEHERQLADELHQAALRLEQAYESATPAERPAALGPVAEAVREAANALGADAITQALEALLAQPGDAQAGTLFGAIAERLGAASSFELYSLAPKSWAALQRAALGLSGEVLRCLEKHEPFGLPCRRFVEHALAAADTLHHQYAVVLLRAFAGVFERPEVSGALALGLTRQLCGSLALHAALESLSTLRVDERVALAEALAQPDRLPALLASGLREQSVTRCLVGLQQEGEVPAAVLGLVGRLFGVSGPEAALGFCSAAPVPDFAALLASLDAKADPQGLARWLGALGVRALSVPGAARFPYQSRLDLVRLQRTVRELVRGNFQLLFDQVPIVEVQATRLAEVKAGLQALRDAQAPAALLDRLEASMAQLFDVPVLPQLVRYHDMVTDMARRLDKRVELRLTGDATISVPPVVMARLHDALVHLLRNGVDHGLEKAPERLAAHKSEVGLLEVACEHRDGELKLVVRDDGRGIDPDRVRATAVKKGLLDPATAPTLTRQACLELILVPHFSTAAATTDLSGRGIGMDVVVKSLAQVGAALRIDSQPGAGSQFTIALSKA